MDKLLNKIKKSVENEKTAVSAKPLAITNDDEQYEKADKFFARESQHTIKEKPSQVAQKKSKIVTSTFSLLDEEFTTITKTMKMFANNDIFLKQTEVFRIAVALLGGLDDNTLLKTYKALPKVSVGKPKKEAP